MDSYSLTSRLLENPADRDAYRNLGHQTVGPPNNGAAFSLRTIVAAPPIFPEARVTTVPAIFAEPTPPVRVIFSPTDVPNKTNIQELAELHTQFNFPSTYLAERHQGVTHAFGARVNDCWLHFLCKNIQLCPGENGEFDIAGQSGQDDSWVNAGWYLSWWHPGAGAAKGDAKRHNVVLISNGNFPALEARLQTFLSQESNVLAVQIDPYALWVPVMTEMWTLMDDIVWGLHTVFGGLEAKIIRLSSNPTGDGAQSVIEFQKLHNLAKHAIHLKEGAEAVLETMGRLEKSHATLFSLGTNAHANVVATSTQLNLEYVHGLFKSVDLRLASLSKKVDNTIHLAFNLVAQQDSKLAREESNRMVKDSNSMRVMTTVMMIFLPGTAIATMFGSNFFYMNDSKGFTTSKDFWVFWAVSIPVSVITLILWKVVIGEAFWKKKN